MALKPITPETAARICALVIGPAGIGKTSLVRTILGQAYNVETGAWEQVTETDDKVCVLSAESGLLCIRDLITSGRVEGFEIGNFTELREAYTALQDQKCIDRYRWLFIDSLTEISARCVETVKAKFPNTKDAFPMWAAYNDEMTSIIKAFRDFSAYNVIFSCLETVSSDQNGVRYKAPMISGSSLKERLTSYFDEVLYMAKVADDNGIQHTIFKTAEPVGVAKDRSGKLNAIENANLLTITNKIL